MFSPIPLACIRGTANRSQIEYQLYQPDLNQVLGFMNLIPTGQNSGIPVAMLQNPHSFSSQNKV
jgi:hypothetical protein